MLQIYQVTENTYCSYIIEVMRRIHVSEMRNKLSTLATIEMVKTNFFSLVFYLKEHAIIAYRAQIVKMPQA